MNVISEDKLCSYIGNVLAQSNDILEHLKKDGTAVVDAKTQERYHDLFKELMVEREHDATLSDERWNWIWQCKEQYNHIQLYGRLAWINLQLLDLL